MPLFLNLQFYHSACQTSMIIGLKRAFNLFKASICKITFLLSTGYFTFADLRCKQSWLKWFRIQSKRKRYALIPRLWSCIFTDNYCTFVWLYSVRARAFVLIILIKSGIVINGHKFGLDIRLRSHRGKTDAQR